MESILLTGASGLLGRSLAKILKKNYNLTGAAFSQTGKWKRVDLTDQHQTEDLLCEVKPDIIVHTVALTDVDQCEEEPALAYRLNVKTLEHIVNWLKLRSPQTHLIFISSDQVYGGPGPHSEEAAFPHNVYALSKYCAERVALSYPYSLILRTNFFGWSECSDKKSFSDWALYSFKNKKYIELITDVLFSPLYLSTLSEYIRYCCEVQLKGLFNIGAASGCSKRDFVHLLAHKFGLSLENAKDIKIMNISLKAYRPHDMRMKIEKFSEVVGVSLPTIEDEIECLYDERPGEWR